MRCYFWRDGHIVGVEVLTAKSDEAAIEEAVALFEKRKPKFLGFEIWDRARFIHRHRQTAPEPFQRQMRTDQER